LYFFFSSRRRHTRCLSDWSSDVCSSDLDVDIASLSHRQLRRERRRMQMIFQDPYAALDPRMTVGQIIAEPIETFRLAAGEEKRRSEERRVGKEGRARGAVERERKKGGTE